VKIVSQRTVLAARQGSQDCIKHTIKILRNCFSKESQHNSSSTPVQAPDLWDLWKVVLKTNGRSPELLLSMASLQYRRLKPSLI
jgi:hypothetical protein